MLAVKLLWRGAKCWKECLKLLSIAEQAVSSEELVSESGEFGQDFGGFIVRRRFVFVLLDMLSFSNFTCKCPVFSLPFNIFTCLKAFHYLILYTLAYASDGICAHRGILRPATSMKTLNVLNDVISLTLLGCSPNCLKSEINFHANC